MDKKLVFTVQFNIKHDCIYVFEKSILSLLDRMSAEDNFVSCYLDKVVNSDARYILYEVWNEPSIETFMKNQSHNYYRMDFNNSIGQWTKSEKIVTILEPVQQWNK